MCGPKGYGFSAVLVIDRISILAILVINRVWFLHSTLELGMFYVLCWEATSFPGSLIFPNEVAWSNPQGGGEGGSTPFLLLVETAWTAKDN